MENVEDIAITVDASTDTVAANGLTFDNLIKVSREGIGLRIVEVPTSTISGNTFYSYVWRYSNPSVYVSAGAKIGKFVTALGIVEYRTALVFGLFGTDVQEGMTYVFTFLGTTVYYVAQSGDGNTDVRAGLKAQIDATTYSYPVTTSTSTYLGKPVLYVDALTGFAPPSTIDVRGVGYFYAKSGLTTVIGGAYYVVSEAENAGYEIPAIPSLGASYDYTTFTLPPYGLEAYLAEGLFPVQENYTLTSVGTADITNNPSLSFSLNPNEVALDVINDCYQFGTSFVSGTPETVQIIYILS